MLWHALRAFSEFFLEYLHVDIWVLAFMPLDPVSIKRPAWGFLAIACDWSSFSPRDTRTSATVRPHSLHSILNIRAVRLNRT
jgi:hypothetical protein